MNQIQQEHFPVKDKLHTDILESKYGPIHVDVIRHDNVREAKSGTERIREARLLDAAGILRTFALTFLTYDRRNVEIAGIDDEIRQGGLIGETFRKNGYEIKKNVIDVFMQPLSVKMMNDFQTDSREAKSRITEFYAKKKGSDPVVYGTVLEIYCPDFKNPADGINDVDINQVNPLTSSLQSVGIPADEIWERLDRASEKNEWGDLNYRYEQAKEMSQSIVRSIHEKIDSYLGRQNNVQND